MGLGDRIGLVFTNIAILIPVFILLLVSAIVSSIGAAKMATLKESTLETAHKYVTWSTVSLWVLFVGSLVFSFTIGLLIIPWLITIPYLYGGVMIMFALINLVIASILFYAANSIRTSQDYIKGTPDAKSAFNYILSSGIMMLISAIFMVGYSVWSIYKYRKAGGLTGDIVIATELAPLVLGPEAAPISTAIGSVAKSALSEGQQTAAVKTATSVQTLADIGKLSATKGMGLTGLVKTVGTQGTSGLVKTVGTQGTSGLVKAVERQVGTAQKFN